MIKLNDLAIGYNGEAILEHIDQEFDDGLIYGILAKSGAGKTTLLKTIAGLLRPVHGKVIIDGTTYRNADKNPVYMMHQRYSNFGWLSCTENVLIAQRDKKLRNRNDAIKVLAAVGLEQYADKWPSQLSGGMQQRLALARTLYVKPRYLLMDEPLSALDDKTRSKMQRLILDIHAETGNTIIMGRKTFESLPKGALPNRRNIVLSTNPATNFPGAEVFPSLKAALQSCHEKEHVYIIGGETVYRQAIELADELCLTEIDNEAPQADAFFPAIDPQIWHKKSKEVHLADEKHLCSYSFVDYIKEL